MKSIWDSRKIGINDFVRKGTIVIFPTIWAETDEGSTPAKDIELIIEEDTTLGNAVVLLEEKAMEYVRSHGAEDIRQYFIEDASEYDNKIFFQLGT